MHLLYGALPVLLVYMVEDGPPLPVPPAEPPASSAPAVTPESVPSSAAPPAASAPEPDVTSKPRRVSIEGWTDIDARCRILTTGSSSGDGCALGLRVGDVAYFHMSGGYLRTPLYERYMRYEGTSVPPVTIIEPQHASLYYLDLGPGIAMWPTRQIQVHIEAGGMMGVIHTPASQALPTKSGTDFALGFFAGIGGSYRIPSMPWAFGFDYRLQGVPYGGLGSGETVTESGVAVGQSLFGLAHSFGLSAIYRIEHDGKN
jgi:hypothetical protein